MTRKQRIAALAAQAREARAIAASIELLGPYAPAPGPRNARYTVRARLTFQPWENHPGMTYPETREYDCRRLSGARRAVREILAALPADCSRAVSGFYHPGDNTPTA